MWDMQHVWKTTKRNENLRPKRKWEDNIKMVLKVIGYEDVD